MVIRNQEDFKTIKEEFCFKKTSPDKKIFKEKLANKVKKKSLWTIKAFPKPKTKKFFPLEKYKIKLFNNLIQSKKRPLHAKIPNKKSKPSNHY